MAQRAQTTSRLRRISLTVSTESTFPVPVSDGYSVYSALLSVLDNVDEAVSAQVHVVEHAEQRAVDRVAVRNRDGKGRFRTHCKRDPAQS